MAAPSQKWIVGLDLRESSRGALALAHWMHTRSPSDHMVGVHVLEEAYLEAVLRYHHLNEVRAGAEKACEKAARESNAGETFDALDVIEGVSAEIALENARDKHQAVGLVVGRNARTDEVRFVRLGAVARRVLRVLHAPTIVVPPDYVPREGPIVVATDMRMHSEPAAVFAAGLAERWNVPLLVTHTVVMPDDYGAHYLPEVSLHQMRLDQRTEGEAALQTWAQSHGLGTAQVRLTEGHPVESVVALVHEVSASMLVVGSRRLSGVERLLLTSVGSELAAASPCPVMVVPPLEK